MNKPYHLYNVIFPVFLLYLVGLGNLPMLLIMLAGNFIIDTIVTLASLKHLHVKKIGSVYKQSILLIWLLGFLADICAAFVMLGITVMLDDFFPSTGTAFTMNPFSSFPALLLTLGCVALGGWLVYLFNKKFSFSKSSLSSEQIQRMALYLALWTAPYAFLIPTTLLYTAA